MKTLSEFALESKKNQKDIGKVFCELISLCNLSEASFKDNPSKDVPVKLCEEFSNAVNTAIPNMIRIVEMTDNETAKVIAFRLNRVSKTISSAKVFIDFFVDFDKCLTEIYKIKEDREALFASIPIISKYDYDLYFGDYNKYRIAMNSALVQIAEIVGHLAKIRRENNTLSECLSFKMMSSTLIKLFAGELRILPELEYHGKISETAQSGAYEIV